MKKASLSRRVFLGSSLIFGAGVLYWIQNREQKVRLYANETQVLLHACYHLFPSSTKGPGAIDLNIASYLIFVLEDQRIMKEDRDHFLKGAYWLEESAYEEYDQSFINLKKEDKESLFVKISQDRWGQNFIYTSLTYIFESLLSSPVYGSNPNEIGWKWLEHNPGFPQPHSVKDINYEI